MYQPRQIDIAVFFIEIVEYHTAYKKSQHGKEHHWQTEPADHHGDMVKGKERRAENIGKFSRRRLFKGQKRKSAEEKFLKQRVCKGYVY